MTQENLTKICSENMEDRKENPLQDFLYDRYWCMNHLVGLALEKCPYAIKDKDEIYCGFHPNKKLEDVRVNYSNVMYDKVLLGLRK